MLGLCTRAAWADPIYPNYTSNSQAGESASGSGSFLSPGIFSSSAYQSSADQASSFVNLTTGEIGAYLAGEQDSAYTTTDSSDQWVCAGACTPYLATGHFSLGLSFTLTATLNEATIGAFKQIDYYFDDGVNTLQFSAAMDGPNDYELSADWDESNISSDVTQTFDSSGAWTLNLNYAATLCDPDVPCAYILPSGFVPYTPEEKVSGEIDSNGTPQYIDSSHSMQFNVLSSAPLTSAGGDTAMLINQPSPVPEPPTWMLLATGVMLLFGLWRLRVGTCPERRRLLDCL
ncbi:MAG: hypothetical protein ACRD1C_13835 [Terriglobales bacterium]